MCTKIRWLLRGRIEQRVFGLREELLVFLTTHKVNLTSQMADEIELKKLCYLAPIFRTLNRLTLSLQERNCNVWADHDKITANSFYKKYTIWKTSINNNIVDMFPVLDDYLINPQPSPTLYFWTFRNI